MKRLLLFVLVSITVLLGADPAQKLNRSQLVSFVQSSIKMRYPDVQLAEYLRRVKLTERLDDDTVESLQNLGAGPKTVAVLHDLRDGSEKLPDPPPPPKPPPPAAEAPPPDSVEQAKILDAARDYALNYSKELPNFLCLERVKRSIDTNLRDEPGSESWQGADSFIARLSFYDQHEDYKVVMQGSKSVNDLDLTKMGGSISQGEFGSMMREIFETQSDTRWDWDHWGKLRGRLMYVFRYDIDQPHSRWSIKWEHDEPVIFAYRGKIYIDRETNKVVRITLSPYDMPSSYPVRASETVLDYELRKVGDTEFLLPSKVVWVSRTIRYISKNDVDFRLYNKFSTDTVIKFDTNPEELLNEKDKK